MYITVKVYTYMHISLFIIKNMIFVITVVVTLCLWYIIQENCNVLVNNEYSEQTRRAMAMLNEKEMSFELIEVCLQVRITTIIYN